MSYDELYIHSDFHRLLHFGMQANRNIERP